MPVWVELRDPNHAPPVARDLYIYPLPTDIPIRLCGMPSWNTSTKDRDLGSYDPQVIFNSIRGLSTVLRDIADTGSLDSDSKSDLEFVADRLEVLLVDLERRSGILHD